MPDSFNLGRHEALIERLVEGQDQLVTRVSSIEHILAEKRGERRASAWMLSAFGGVIGAAATLFAEFMHKK